MRRGRKSTPPTTSLGRLLRERRSTATGDEIAVSIGVDRITYYRLERGVQMPSIATAAKLAAWLGLTVGQVIDAAREPAGEGG